MPIVPQFENRAVEVVSPDSEEISYRDEEWVMLRVDSKTVTEFRVSEILPKWKQQAVPRGDDTAVDRENQDLARWLIDSYEAWKKGEEVAVDGTDIRAWPLISAAQCKSARKQGILSVEQMAGAEDNVLQYVPRGRWLKQQAKAWLENRKDSGAAVKKVASLAEENEALKMQMEQLRADVAKMLAEQDEDAPEMPGAKPKPKAKKRATA